MFAQHPGNQGKEGGVDSEKERRKRKENHIAAKSAWVSSSTAPPVCGLIIWAKFNLKYFSQN